MRRPSLAVLAVLFVTLVAGACTSTQPDSGGKQTASLRVRAIATVDLVDCYEVWVDTNGDTVPDFNTGRTQCFLAPGVEGKVTRSVPWRYSIEVSLIPDGATTETLVGSSVVPGDSIDDFVSLTDFDQTPPETSGSKPPNGTTYYLNGKRVSQGSALYISSLNIDVGQPNILEVYPSFDLKIGTGDTVIVRVRKQPASGAPSYIDVNDPTTRLQIEGVLTIGGVAVDVSGDPVSATSDKAGFSFSFTKR